MKFLVDNAMSPAIAAKIREAGYQADHVHEVGIPHAADVAIANYAAEHGYVVVTADSDFSMITALQQRTKPSVVLLHGTLANHPEMHADVLLSNLPPVIDRLAEGAIVIVEAKRIRVRMLPIID